MFSSRSIGTLWAGILGTSYLIVFACLSGGAGVNRLQVMALVFNAFESGVPADPPLKGEFLGDYLQLSCLELGDLCAADLVSQFNELISEACSELVTHGDLEGYSRLFASDAKAKQSLMRYVPGLEHVPVLFAEYCPFHNSPSDQFESLELHFYCRPCSSLARIICYGLAVSLQAEQDI